jgi:uncharacterized protein
MQRIDRLVAEILGSSDAAAAGAAVPAAHPLYGDLIGGIDASPVRQLAIGRAWILVRTAHGAGLAFAPRWPDGTAPARLERLDGLTGRDLAALALRGHVLAAAIGMAAINAHYNRPDHTGSDDDGLDAGSLQAGAAGPVVVIGRFPGLDDKLPGALVIERNPGPHDLPESAAARVLPTAGRVIITASTLTNHSLPRLLALAPQAAISLIGPGTPLAPCLFDHGIATLAGFVLDRPDAAAEMIAAGAGYGKLKGFGRRLTIRRTG